MLQEALEVLQGVDKELETVEDIRTSCDTAVTILNEVLMFDKLKSGTLLVEKTNNDMKSLIKDAITPFSIQTECDARWRRLSLMQGGGGSGLGLYSE